MPLRGNQPGPKSLKGHTIKHSHLPFPTQLLSVISQAPWETVVAYVGGPCLYEFCLVEFTDCSKDITVNGINFLKEHNELSAV